MGGRREGGRERVGHKWTEHEAAAASGSLVYLPEQLVLLHALCVLPDGGGVAVDLLLEPDHHRLVLVPEIGLGGGRGSLSGFTWLDFSRKYV